jgi:ferredoxin
LPTVRFLNELVTVEVPEGAILRDVALAQNIEVYRGMWGHMNCAGNGICGRCRVWLVHAEKAVSTPSIRERMHRIRGSQRLACQVRIVGDLEIRSRPIGPSVVERGARPTVPAYLAAAEQRYREAKEEEARAAAAPKK